MQKLDFNRVLELLRSYFTVNDVDSAYLNQLRTVVGDTKDPIQAIAMYLVSYAKASEEEEMIQVVRDKSSFPGLLQNFVNKDSRNNLYSIQSCGGHLLFDQRLSFFAINNLGQSSSRQNIDSSEIDKLRAENEALRARIVELETENARLTAANAAVVSPGPAPAP